MDEFAFLKSLNQAQLNAVKYVDGPSLVIAGAGSGKTMVLTYKIAYLLKLGLKPWNILALTFTNKAAREMKERVAKMVGEMDSQSLYMGTFHSIFNRILRVEGHLLGYSNQFTIYQPSDSESLVKAICKEMKLDDKTYKPKFVCDLISEAKNALVTPRDYLVSRETRNRDEHSKVPMLGEIYATYVNRCRQANAMDFDDLLLNLYLLFDAYPEICAKYSQRFQYILVDEYQDTNYAQHAIMQQLSKEHQRICVVGDDAQSIYSFRGANIDNILHFTTQYPDAKMFKLERNYRSTKIIVGAANCLIANNKHQIPKTVFSEREDGHLICLSNLSSDYEEGCVINGQISRLHEKENLPYSDMAILYRTKAQSRIFEEVLRRNAIPYKLFQALSFYDRKIIKNILAYFRLIVNPNDEEAFKRVVNYPKRGLGDTSINKIVSAANQNNKGIWDVAKDPLCYGVDINQGTQAKLQGFVSLITQFIGSELDAFTLGENIVKASGVWNEVRNNEDPENLENQQHLSELLNGMQTFVETRREEGNEEHVTLYDYLSEITLLSDTDAKGLSDYVSLMTVHASKGLEFNCVFVAGMDETIFPSSKSLNSPRDLEEERRLFYVALTRAKSRCFISHAKMRNRFGSTEYLEPSQFLKEIDKKYLEKSPKTFAAPQRGYNFDFGYDDAPKARQSFAPPKVRRIVTPKEEEEEKLDFIVLAGRKCVVGQRVKHDRFGEGSITALEGSVENCKVAVAFDNVGEKHLLLKYAKLTPL